MGLNLKRTPLFETHQQLGARLVDFGGWEMPLQYTSILDEHIAVRTAAGIFDISHMGEFFVTGPASLDFLNQSLTNDVSKLSPGRGQYTLMCNEAGGVIDDLYLYCLGLGNYLLVVNASRIDADFHWLTTRRQNFPRPDRVFIENKSASYGAVAIQGPKAADFIDTAFSATEQSHLHPLRDLTKNEVKMVAFRGELVYVARTGYTGEDGFELIAPAPLIEKVWSASRSAGSASGLKPCGLGARDTLRTEACYPLYGHELTEQTTPIEAGLAFFVALEKGDFTGRSVLAEQKKAGPSRKLVAFKMSGRSAPPRQDYPIWSTGEPPAIIGRVTSGTQSPTLAMGVGMGYVLAEFAQPETLVEIEIRGNRCPATVVKKPIYKRAQ